MIKKDHYNSIQSTKTSCYENSKNIDIKDIPLPNEMPKKVDLSNLPEHIIKSSAIESLIQQNEDLMARLSVHIRRTSVLEGRVNEKDQQIRRLTQEIEKIHDQVQVLSKKDDLWKTKIDKTEDDLNNYKEKAQIIEYRYQELLENTKEKQKKIKDSFDILTAQLYRLDKYHRSIRYRIRPWINELKIKTNLLDQKKDKLEIQILKRDQQNEELKNKLTELLTRLREQDETHKLNIHQITQSYEDRLALTKYQLEQQNNQLSQLDLKAKKLEEMMGQHVVMENKLVFAERRYEELKKVYDEETSTLKDDVELEKKRYIGFVSELESLKKQKEHFEQRIKIEKEEKKNWQQQKEHFEAICLDQKNIIENSIAEKARLETINHELHKAINTRVEDLENIKNHSDSNSKASIGRLEILQREIRLLKSIEHIGDKGTLEQQEQTLEDIGQLLDQMTNHLIKLKQPEQSMKSNSMFPAMSLDGFDFQEENSHEEETFKEDKNDKNQNSEINNSSKSSNSHDSTSKDRSLRNQVHS